MFSVKGILRAFLRVSFCLLLVLASMPSLRVSAAGSGTVVIEALTGRMLYGENPDARLPMASTTKIMTALLTLEQQNLDTFFSVDPAAIQVEGTSMGLKQGDQATLRTLAAGMLLASGNDAANAAAVRVAGSVPAFVDRMNQRALEMGLSNTHFDTPSGLDGETHYSSARDMALLAAEALENPDFAAICGQESMRVEIGHPPKEITLYNHNRLLREYEGCIGVKTGFTKKAGRCLVSAARRDGITLICVTLGVYDDWNVHKRLLDRCFEMVTPFALTPSLLPETLPVAGGQGGYCTVGLLEEGVVGRVEGDASLEEELFLPPFAYPNMGPGQVLGWVRWRLDGKELARLPVGILEVTYDAGQGSG